MQASIAKGVEEKMSSDQRKYMLNEQLRAIKKVGFYSLKNVALLTMVNGSSLQELLFHGENQSPDHLQSSM